MQLNFAMHCRKTLLTRHGTRADDQRRREAEAADGHYGICEPVVCNPIIKSYPPHSHN